ncbi:MAG: RecQ family ATP-dependent DNA helicase [bacterium]|nr:RecQ family ATP-dependent DNA helicase [bacterium]
MDSPQHQLEEKFGFDHFLPGQEDVLGHLLEGRSAAAVFPTGGGKSLCYQLPALLLPGLTLVVSPLIALMKDQIDQLKRRGIAAERLDSTLTADEYRDIMARIRGGDLRLLYVAPERFNNERFRGSLARVQLSLFAVDEAHCISEWGHNFRPDYLKLAGFAERFGAERVLALTATATPRVLEDICRGFRVAPEAAVRTGFHRPNLELRATPVAAADRDAELERHLAGRTPGPTIVYVTLQRTAEEVAERLAVAGFDARPYHAGLKDDRRAAVQDWFLASDTAVVVATIAFGMGIDKSNIRYVYHYNLAKSLENLSQEIGRAGRDGEPAVCESLVCPDDLTVLQNFAYGDTPSLDGVRGLLEEVAAEADRFDVSLIELSNRHDVRILVVRTLLTYLELQGYLEAGTPRYAKYRFQPLYSSKEILAGFQGERRRFLEAVFRRAKKARTWFDIDLEAAARDIGAPRGRLVRALDFLAERQQIELKVGGVRHRYTWLRRPEDIEALASELHAKTLEHERREIERLDLVLDLVGRDGCQTAWLCEYFGETLDGDCGHCGWCLDGGRAVELPPLPEAAVDDEVWRQASELRAEHAEVLEEPRAFARLLTGLRSPRITRAKLAKHPLFGALAHVPFSAVLERASQNRG